MRPIKLIMQAFNSYGRRQEINFSEFGKEGLFLVTGPTGSGKTTIFDGIMYALYGTACSKDRSADMIRSLVCSPTAETQVSLVFESGGQTYTIIRSPAYVRPAKKGNGEVTVRASVRLELPDQTVLTRQAEVESQIRDIIGLDKNQFRQVALLAQGDFRQILTGDTSSRMKILRSLFGTDRYEKLEQKLKDQLSSAVSEEQGLRASLDTAIQSIEGYSPEVFELEAFTVWNQEQKHRLVQLKQDHSSLEQSIQEMVREIGRMEEMKRQYDSFQNAAAQLQIWQPRLKAAELEEKRLEAEKTDMEQCRLKAEKIRQAIEAGQLKEKLKISIMQSTEEIDQTAARLCRLQKELKEAEEQERIQTADLHAAQGLEEKQKQVAHDRELLARASAAENEKKRLEIKADQENTVYQQALQSNIEADQKEQTARTLYLEGQAGILAQQLHPDQPCPVCGALHHPHPARLLQETPDASSLEELHQQSVQARSRCDEAFTALNSTIQELAAARSRLQALLTSLPEDLSAENLNRQQAELQNALAARDRLEKSIQTLQQQKQQLLQKQEMLHKHLEEAEKKRSRAQGQMLQLSFPYASVQEAEAEKKALMQSIEEYEQKQISVQEEKLEALRQCAQAQGILESCSGQKMEDVSQKLATIRLDKAASESGSRKLAATIQDLESTWKHNQKLEDTIAHYQQQHQKQLEVCTEIRELNNAINGASNMNGQGRMDLETYVQAAYYEQVLEKANLRLLEMTDERYELVRRQEASGNSRIGLDLDILDRYCGKVRPASGLSGGESFMASLALALGLSDAIQQSSGGSALDTLFVDEGFGSLDQEALNNAIHTLNTLADSRLVGIISHVESIRQLIPAQISVSQDKNGCSQARTFA